MQENMIWTTTKIKNRRSCAFVKKSCKTKIIVTKNKSGNPDSTINSLPHTEETLDNETPIQATTRSSDDGRGHAKA